MVFISSEGNFPGSKRQALLSIPSDEMGYFFRLFLLSFLGPRSYYLL